MLKIFYGRENIDKEKFIFQNAGKKPLIIVPDQFTLEAEQAALRCLQSDVLMGAEIISMSGFGSRIISEKGGETRDFVDKYGRHIILAAILDKENDSLEAFRGMKDKTSFIQLVSDFISELKQFNVSPEKLSELSEDDRFSPMLARKLRDMAKVYSLYDEYIAGKYVDSDDYINLYLPKISGSKLITGRPVWIWGFDWFAPNTMDVLLKIMEETELNVVLTYDRACEDWQNFEITEGVINSLKKRAAEKGIEHIVSQIDDEYVIPTGLEDNEKSSAIAALEKNLFTVPWNPLTEAEEASVKRGDVTLVTAANYYAEAETAAVYILWLLRQKHLRLRDISVICNDMEVRGNVVKRVFEEYGIPLFVDNKRGLLHHPSIAFVVYLIDIVSNGYRSEDIFALLKTGFTNIENDSIEDLENYAIKYKIRGAAWKKPFQNGSSEYGEEKFALLEESRQEVVSFIGAFEEEYKKSRKAGDRTEALYRFLCDTAELPTKLQEMIDALEEKGFHEEAEESAQVWEYFLAVIKQIKHIMGDETLSLTRYEEIFRAGLSAVEIGLLPPTADGLVMGSMQRSRTGKINALVIIGANEGLLPKQANSDGIVSEEDKKEILGGGNEIAKLSDLQSKEERLALYRCISSPQKYLYMSCSVSDIEGKKERPSMIFGDVSKYLGIKPKADITASQKTEARLQSGGSALRYITQALSNFAENGIEDEVWLEGFKWCNKHLQEQTSKMLLGMFYENPRQQLERQKIEKLYGDNKGEIKLSPSSLEKYSRCPFSHFVSYGLRPDERRKFEIAGREIGDIYHECLMKFSRSLTEENVKVSDPAGKWQNLTRELSDKLILEKFDEVTKGYREGIAESGSEEAYRIGRMKKILCENAWALVTHVQAGKIDSMAFEKSFGRGKDIDPVEVPIANNKAIRIEGKIDRIDYLEGNTVKVIDYKSGTESIKPQDAEYGWRLQLMLYLKAATEGVCKEERKFLPAGVFYFMIKDKEITGDGIDKDKLTVKINEALSDYKMQGIIVDNPDVIKNTAGSFEGWSDIVTGLRSVKGEGSGFKFQSSNLMSSEEFEEFEGRFDKMLEGLCNDLTEGMIEARPKKTKNMSACTYCPYHSICKFEQIFAGCSYERIPC